MDSRDLTSGLSGFGKTAEMDSSKMVGVGCIIVEFQASLVCEFGTHHPSGIICAPVSHPTRSPGELRAFEKSIWNSGFSSDVSALTMTSRL